MTNIYSTPAASLTTNSDHQAQTASILLKISCIVLTLLTMLAAVFKALALESQAGEVVGSALGTIIWGLIIVGIFQIWKKFRNQKSRYKIYLWCQIVFFITQIMALIKALIALGLQG